MGNAKPDAEREEMPSWPSVTNTAHVHQRSLSDPEGFWAEQAKAIDWTRRWDKVLDDSKAPFYRWFAGGELNTCHNALDRHVEGGRAAADGADLRFAGHQYEEELHLPRAARSGGEARRRHRRTGRRQGRPRHHLHADDPGSGDGDAGLRAAGRGAFRGVRRLCRQRARHPHRRLHAQAGADGVVRHRAGPGGAVQALARPGDRARRGTRSRAAWCSSGRRPRPRW